MLPPRSSVRWIHFRNQSRNYDQCCSRSKLSACVIVVGFQLVFVGLHRLGHLLQQRIELPVLVGFLQLMHRNHMLYQQQRIADIGARTESEGDSAAVSNERSMPFDCTRSCQHPTSRASPHFTYSRTGHSVLDIIVKLSKSLHTPIGVARCHSNWQKGVSAAPHMQDGPTHLALSSPPLPHFPSQE